MQNYSEKSETVQDINAIGKKSRFFLYGIAIGAAASAITVFYRYMITVVTEKSDFIISLAKENPIVILLWFGILAASAFVITKLLRFEPFISGSGIPHVKAETAGYLEHKNPIKILICKIGGGLLCMFCGLSLGREGPSVQMGALGGKALAKATKRNSVEEKYFLTCGGAAGLTAAFNAPLAGIIFAVEEINKSFTPALLMCAGAACVTADFISKYVFGLGTVFNITVTADIPLSSYWALVLLGAVLGLCGAFYNLCVSKSQDLFAKLSGGKKDYIKILIPFMCAGLFAFTMPQVLGGGGKMMALLTSKEGIAVLAAVVLLLTKFIYSVVCTGSGAPGGIFFPMLVMGAYLGMIFASVAGKTGAIDSQFTNDFIIIAMAGFFTAIVRAPITGIVLTTELTGSMSYILPVAVVCAVAYITADMLKSKPVYESMMDKIVRKIKKAAKINGEENSSLHKEICTISVDIGSSIDGAMLKDVKLPLDVLVVSVLRGDEEIIPRGETLLQAGDVLCVLINEKDKVKMTKKLEKMAKFKVK